MLFTACHSFSRFSWCALLGALTLTSSAFAEPKINLIRNIDTVRVVEQGFGDAGSIRGVERTLRVNQDELQAACSNPKASFSGVRGVDYYNQLIHQQKITIVYPADGQMLGDWKEGEKLAQSGRGLTWTDKAGDPIGGGCYNCHQMAAKELSFGTIGPSLFKYGKNKGNNAENLRDTWARIYNAKAFNACSWMPRFGAQNILSEKQLKDLMAFLHDPQSPVNQ